MLYVSHRLATPLSQNDSFPNGLVTGIINFLCPCTPVSNLGWINLFSTLCIILKVILLYPITIFDVLPVEDNFDRFRCSVANTTNFRKCEDEETTNQLLFEIVLPITISSLILFSIPVGFIMSKLMARANLEVLNEHITVKLESFTLYFSNICECLICCCKRSTDVDAQTD